MSVRIEFKDKKNSSGRIRGGEIVLYISSRLPRSVQQQHIEILTGRLQARLAAQAAAPVQVPPELEAMEPSGIADNAALEAWAREINRRHYNFAMGRVSFRNQRSRWGSCSGLTRNIYVSHRLKNAPRELLEYLLIHEISHLGQMNHSSRFWKLVERACPDYKQRRQLLQAWGRLQEAGGIPED